MFNSSYCKEIISSAAVCLPCWKPLIAVPMLLHHINDNKFIKKITIITVNFRPFSSSLKEKLS